jgi:phosphoribosylglycinamide formyltransferase-1
VSLVLGVLCSGRGSNLGAVLEAIATGRLQARVAVVISNRPGAPALERARQAGVLVVLAGFMRLLTPVFLDTFAGRVVNVHPSLLPAFPGVAAQRQALEHGVKMAGCTVHFVELGTDTGPIISQAAVPVVEGDSVESLSARILVEEHRLLPAALQLLAERRITVAGRRVHIAP